MKKKNMKNFRKFTQVSVELNNVKHHAKNIRNVPLCFWMIRHMREMKIPQMSVEMTCWKKKSQSEKLYIFCCHFCFWNKFNIYKMCWTDAMIKFYKHKPILYAFCINSRSKWKCVELILASTWYTILRISHLMAQFRYLHSKQNQNYVNIFQT